MKYIAIDDLQRIVKDVTLQGGVKHRCIDCTKIHELKKTEDIVHCNECRRRFTEGCPFYMMMMGTTDNFFCAEGRS